MVLLQSMNKYHNYYRMCISDLAGVIQISYKRTKNKSIIQKIYQTLFLYMPIQFIFISSIIIIIN